MKIGLIIFNHEMAPSLPLTAAEDCWGLGRAAARVRVIRRAGSGGVVLSNHMEGSAEYELCKARTRQQN